MVGSMRHPVEGLKAGRESKYLGLCPSTAEVGVTGFPPSGSHRPYVISRDASGTSLLK